MEEAVWVYFGVIMAILALGIVTSLFVTYHKAGNEQLTMASVDQLGRQSSIVCSAPKDTQLSTPVTIVAGARIYTLSDRICVKVKETTRCAPSQCPLEEKTVIDLTGVTLFESHEYTCVVQHGNKINITCSG